MRFCFPLLLLLLFQPLFAQRYPLRKVSPADLSTKSYELDTTANAIVLAEFGEAYVDNGGDYNVIVEYHIKIKILKKEGLSFADFEIPLYKNERQAEQLRSIQAFSYNLENGKVVETKLNSKDVFTENQGKNYDIKKFAIPNVKVGSVIEVFYITESPYFFKFHGWEFQSTIPKLYSEYWATIPGNYLYNMSIKGYLKLNKNESEIIRDCFSAGGGKADCVRYKWAMRNIPAFIEEDYMTAKSNFLSSINFELSEIKHFDGRVDKVTKEWKDAESELKQHDSFGTQLRKGRDVLEDQIQLILLTETDPLKRLDKIYDLVRYTYRWNGKYGMLTDVGIKKAFEGKTGNVADINLTLVAVLRTADFNVDPVILSTRENGLPIDIHPVLSDFNYVVARVKVGDKYYMLDATDKNVPMGVLPIRCLNGKGRVLAEDGSFFTDLVPIEKEKSQTVYNVRMDESGTVSGTVQTVYYGYAAIRKRREISERSDSIELLNHYKTEYNPSITSVRFENLEDVKQPLKEILTVSVLSEAPSGDGLLLNPFLLKRWNKNPFVSTQRSFPVDFAVPIEHRVTFTLQYPADMVLPDVPAVVKNGLRGNGGSVVFETVNRDNSVTVNYFLQLNKSIYEAYEYPQLRELFNIIVQVQNTDLYLKKSP
jgi:hypothetical protein